jgi:hypothetical protein
MAQRILKKLPRLRDCLLPAGARHPMLQWSPPSWKKPASSVAKIYGYTKVINAVRSTVMIFALEKRSVLTAGRDFF